MSESHPVPKRRRYPKSEKELARQRGRRRQASAAKRAATRAADTPDAPGWFYAMTFDQVNRVEALFRSIRHMTSVAELAADSPNLGQSDEAREGLSDMFRRIGEEAAEIDALLQKTRTTGGAR